MREWPARAEFCSYDFTRRRDEVLSFLDEESVCGKQLHVLRNESGNQGGELSAFGEEVSLLISSENVPDPKGLCGKFASRFAERVVVRDGLAAISVLGAGINASYNNLRRGFRALEGVAFSDVFTSSFRITWIVPENELEQAVLRLHREFEL